MSDTRKTRQPKVDTRKHSEESEYSPTPNSPHKKEAKKRPYETPVLICYGDVRDITLGGSINPGDPGVPGGTRRNF